MDEIKLDLMDWKQIETESEESIRDHMRVTRVSEIVRIEAKKQIKSFGGLTSEEERKAEKKERERLATTATG